MNSHFSLQELTIWNNDVFFKKTSKDFKEKPVLRWPMGLLKKFE